MTGTILFDGVCNLCNRFVRFVIVRDPHARFRFAPLTSAAARSLLRESGVAEPLPDSMVLIEDGRVYFRSDAQLRVVRRLRFPWPLFYGFIVVPRFVRDRVYDTIAAGRYRWFGRRETCMVPTPDVARRFLADGENGDRR